MTSFTEQGYYWARAHGRQKATTLLGRVAHQVQLNLSPRRLLSFPHLLFGFWVVILLWGERWVFESKVDDCAWKSWEQWPKGAKPHHLALVADPQIIDPHSYPGRPWPLSSLTVLITDNYLRRGYSALQSRLRPDSVFFLGDLFDGGREWKTRQGEFADPKFGRERSSQEKAWVDTWHRRYGEDYWLGEYMRFSEIFFDRFGEGGDAPGVWQRGRKLVASLPGNHDLGFGAQIQVPVRDRFSAFFGEGNRVDVVGNHTIVSVDTVSLSADTSDYKASDDVKPIYQPAEEFLKDVKSIKERMIQHELDVWHDTGSDARFGHHVDLLKDADMSDFPQQKAAGSTTDLPTILLTHVPLYRNPGTPCGPRREHWPPQKPLKGQTGPVVPDERNAISVTAGYQYQNVLSEEDSVKLIKSVGNVVHVFSGDDHDYCDVVHSESKENVHEITVKSLSMAMGVPTPGFLMVSMYNPVDATGAPLPGSPETTLQTHLCLLPNQIHTYMQYVSLIVVSLVLLTVRALLVPVLNLTPFASTPTEQGSGYHALPMFKDKMDPPESMAMRSTSSGTSAHHFPARLSATASRGRSMSITSNGSSSGGHGESSFSPSRWQTKKGGRAKNGGRRWGWGDGPRITLDEAYYDNSKWRRGSSHAFGGGKARGATIGTVGRELWTTTFRTAWMVVLFWIYLARER